jgi:hypothetical protein
MSWDLSLHLLAQISVITATYSNRNIIEKLFQTLTMRIDRFHETWNGS